MCSTAFQYELYIATENHILERDDSVREHFLRHIFQLSDILEISVVNFFFRHSRKKRASSKNRNGILVPM